ncbi:MAG: nucleoside deaminase [Alphaproteobacteria bacterium]|nr:nucleoside deaminase [Alphaproteobacteria bacterium]MCB9931421.1 nucleoside deaminase [Alphaproteobacteria bacterium]
MPADASISQAAAMARALEIAATAADQAGALPYAAVVVLDGRIVGEGLNRAQALSDPTSHGETEAIRDACKRLGTTSLAGAIMVTTAEPCAMCVATMLLAGITQLVYAADARDSAAFMAKLVGKNPAVRRRFSMEELRDQVGLPADARRHLPAHRESRAESLAIFDAFAARHG